MPACASHGPRQRRALPPAATHTQPHAAVAVTTHIGTMDCPRDRPQCRRPRWPPPSRRAGARRACAWPWPPPAAVCAGCVGTSGGEGSRRGLRQCGWHLRQCRVVSCVWDGRAAVAWMSRVVIAPPSADTSKGKARNTGSSQFCGCVYRHRSTRSTWNLMAQVALIGRNDGR